MPYSEADAIAELTASYGQHQPEELYAERTVLLRELENAREPAERRLCAAHFALLDAELTRRGLPMNPPAPDDSAAA